MASIKFPRKEFEKQIKLTKEVEDKISMIGTHLESLNDSEIELEILPNRPDLFSMQGFIRTFKAFLGKETGLKRYKLNPAEKDFRVKVDPSVKTVRPFTVCAIVKNLRFDDAKIKEIIDIQEKLHMTLGRNRKKLAIGIYPLEKISLPITYEARKPQDIKFIPLESEKEMNGLQILRDHPTGREYAKLLEGKSLFPVFVDAKGNILSMPPIINSHETGRITQKTREVFIECSGFDFNTLSKTLNMIVTTLSDMGGEIYSMDLEYGGKKEVTPSLEPEKMKISIENANKLLGLNLKEKDLEKLLPRMGYDYKKGIVSIPAWRTDILHEVDIIEDIAIAYGYDHFIPEIPSVATIGEIARENKLSGKISDILSGLGLLEASSLHLVKTDEMKNIENKIEIADSKTEYKFLRPNLTIPALRIISENKDNEYPQRFFEIGKSFSLDKNSESGIKEENHLLIASIPSNFTEMKQILDYLMKMLNLEYSIEDSSNKGMIDGRTASISFNRKEIGFIGEVHPEVLENWNIKQPLTMIEISLEEIYDFLG